MGTKRLLFVTWFFLIAYCSAQEPQKAAAGVNAIDVDGDLKKYFKIGAARDGLQKAILDEVLPAGDHNNFIDDEIEDPGAYDEDITDQKNEQPLFIPRLYRNETAEEKAATATTKTTTTTTTTTTPRPTVATTARAVSHVIENLVTDVPQIAPQVQPQRPPQTFPPPQPRPQPSFVPPQVIAPQQPLPQPQIQPTVQQPAPFIPQQPHQFVQPPPVAPQPLPPRPSQQPFPQQPFPQQPIAPQTFPQQQIPQQPLPQQPLPQQFLPQRPLPQQPLPQQPFPQASSEHLTSPPQTVPSLPPQPAPVQQPPPPQQRPQPPRPQDPTGLRTGVCRQSIFYITAPVHPVDTHLTFTHFAAVVSVDQCARTCHEFNCAIAHYDPATGHCQFNPSTAFSIREGQCPRWPANHYKNNYVSNQPIRIFCIVCQRGRRSRNRNTGRSFLSHRDVHGFVRRPKNKAFQPTVIGRAASTHFNVHGVILRQPQSTAIGLGPFTQRENSFLVSKKSNDTEQQEQLIEIGEQTPASAPTVEEEVSVATESAPETTVVAEETTPATESASEVVTLSPSTDSPVTDEEAETEATTRRPRRKLHRANGIVTHIRRISKLEHH
ncbi:hypothetical protein QR680_001298 [Steinernema hermaphroditum]|uniref:Apple domain-containing protein n=1 Tax=Steinernema hermaphroditum TaxID=289476 RepID=A0AA39GXQ2_9BILA|nr:hypothetical protein QR680_001298 [Steinernema hermaphroditum]